MTLSVDQPALDHHFNLDEGRSCRCDEFAVTGGSIFARVYAQRFPSPAPHRPTRISGRASAARMKTSRKAFVAVIAAVVLWATLSGRLVIMFVAIALISAFFHRSIEYEIAEPYQGWVIITYRKLDCKPLDRKGLSLVVRVDKSGRGCTSDPRPLGWRHNRYVYVAENGNRTPISPDMISADAISSPTVAEPYEDEHFFVGSTQDLKSAWAGEPE